MSMTTSFLNACRNANASRATRTHASGSSPFTWKIGACTILATSVAYTDDRAAGAVAAQRGQVQRFGDDALAGKGRVTVQQQRQYRILAAAIRQQVLLR